MPFSLAKVLKMVYHAVISSGICTYACKDWCKNPITENTWANFKNILPLDYNELRE